MSVKYIVAGCRPWLRDTFEEVAGRQPGLWMYVTTPEELNRAVRSNVPRYIFFLHWSWMVPKDIWSRFECVCFHMTDLPYGRGGSPLQNLILAGVTETKVTALRMVEDLDAGPVYTKRSMTLEGRAEHIYRRAEALSWEMIDWLIANEPQPTPQQGRVVHFKRRRPEQSELPSTGGVEVVYDHIRMLDAPTYPLAFVRHGDFVLEFSHAEWKGDEVQARVRIRENRATETSRAEQDSND